MRNVTTLFFMFLLVACAGTAHAQESRTITTWGSAALYVVPDRAVITVSVFSEDADVAKAIADNVSNADKLVKALKVAGINDSQIATGHISVDAFSYGGFGGFSSSDKRPVIRTFSITVTDLKSIDKVLEVAIKNGANRVNGVELQSSTLAKHREEARRQAIHAAREKAVRLTETLGWDIARPKEIIETGPAFYPSSGTLGPPTDTATSMSPSPDKILVEATVRVTFELK